MALNPLPGEYSDNPSCQTQARQLQASRATPGAALLKNLPVSPQPCSHGDAAQVS